MKQIPLHFGIVKISCLAIISSWANHVAGSFTEFLILSFSQALLYDEKQSVQTRGLVVLLLSKTFGPPISSGEQLDPEHSPSLQPSPSSSPPPPSSTSMVSGIYASQRTIAELVEVVYTADLIHRGLLDVSDRSDFQVCL